MQRIKVAVLRGGLSNEYEVSLKTGKNVLDNLSDKYIPTDVLIDKKGIWHVDGVPITPAKVFQANDVIFNAMHGEYGEDGKVQQFLDNFGVKYTGSKALASAIGMNKILAKEIFVKNKIKTPVYKVVKKGEDISKISHNLFRTFPMPAIVKPHGSGSSVGVSIAKNISELEISLENAFKYSDIAIIEEFVSGKEGTCGVIEDFRGKKVYSLLPIEIIKPIGSDFFDYNTKYNSQSREVCPGNFSAKDKKTMQEMAIKAHEVLGLRHYSRSDFIIHPKRGVFILEVNTLPGLTGESLLPKSLKAVGCSISYFLDHIISLALKKK
ncbi:MAG: D-alanine--D-alanine ligase [Minisyncoccia bacterium]